MKRGEIWTMAGGPGYASKPRPAVIIQEDGFTETLSIAVCPLTSQPIEAPMLRIKVAPSPENGPLSGSPQPHNRNITWEITTQAFLSPNTS